MKVLAFMAEGFEEVECLAVVDVLRRAGIHTELVSISEQKEVCSSHQVLIKADKTLGEADLDHADVLFLPGGMPGARNLAACKPLCDALIKAAAEGRHLAAICAGPSVLGKLGLLKDKKATCYPGFENELLGAETTKQGVVTDGKITTARGLGYALDLGLEIVNLMLGEDKAKEIKASIQYDQC